MKIKVRTGDLRFSVPIPFAMIGVAIKLTPNRFFRKININTPEPYCNLITKETMTMIAKECTKISKEYKGLEIIHVEASDGTFVSIKL